MNEDLLLQLLEKFHSQGYLKVALLFGSYARGEAHSRSDIDLAIFLQTARLLIFVDESIEYFEKKMQGMDRDHYFADRT